MTDKTTAGLSVEELDRIEHGIRGCDPVVIPCSTWLDLITLARRALTADANMRKEEDGPENDRRNRSDDPNHISVRARDIDPLAPQASPGEECKLSANGYCVVHKSYADYPGGPRCIASLANPSPAAQEGVLSELQDDAYGPGGPMSGKTKPTPSPCKASLGISDDVEELCARLEEEHRWLEKAMDGAVGGLLPQAATKLRALSARVGELEEEIEVLRTSREQVIKEGVRVRRNELAAAQAEIKKLREALEWIEQAAINSGQPNFIADKARAALRAKVG